MATVGKPRITVDEMAKLVQRKSDDIADNMFCITHGSDRLLLKPAPYFRSQVFKKQTAKPINPLIEALKVGAFFGVGAAILAIAKKSNLDPVAVGLSWGTGGLIIGLIWGLFQKFVLKK